MPKRSKQGFFASATASFLLLSFVTANAQTSLQLERTNSPSGYVETLLENISENGTGPLRAWLTKLGLGAAQIDAIAINLDAGLEKDERHTIKIIEEIDNAGVLRQVYAYSHFGHNTWMFWRIDFVRTGDQWTVSGFQFDSEYRVVMATKFDTATVVE